MKRMVVSTIWEDSWFMDLSPSMKLLWFYIITKTDQKAVWEVNLKLASFHCGYEYEMKEVKAAFKNKFVEINGKYWFIPNFIKHHHGSTLSRDSNFHKPVIEFIETNNLMEAVTRAGISIKQGIVVNEDKEEILKSIRKYWRRLPSEYELEQLAKLETKYLDAALRESSKYNKQSIAYVSAVIEGIKKKEAIQQAKTREEKARLMRIEEKRAAENPEAKEVFAKLFSNLKKELNIHTQKSIKELRNESNSNKKKN